MPKVKLNRDIQRERVEFRRNMIESKARLRGYRTQVELEKALGVPGNWVSRRLRGETEMVLNDLDKLDKLLRFNAEELAQLIRGR